MMNKKGMVGMIIGLIIAIIALVAVAIPITDSVIESSNLTGITATIVGFLPVFLALAGLALTAGVVMKGN
jgi:uncharacterized membrane protein